MKELNKNFQWTELLADGTRHMFKLRQVQVPCEGCCFMGYVESGDQSDGFQCCSIERPCDGIENALIVDLGIVNDDGCLPEERTGKYPDVERINKQGCNELWRASVSDYTNVSVFGALSVSVCCYGSTKQEAIDNWNRRA